MYRILNTTGNESVTGYYIDIIKAAIELSGNKVQSLVSLKGVPKSDTIVVITVLDALIQYLKGYKNIVLWVQGILPEESYLKHRSHLRKIILEIIEKMILRRAKLIFFVSTIMKKHYEEKYKLDFNGRYFIMPCFNTSVHEKTFYHPYKYNKNIFVYVGGLSVWQCFDDTLKLYACIEKKYNSEVELRVFTPEIDLANDLIKKHGIKHYLVKYVPNEKLYEELIDVKYGFVIRDNISVNHVSTPTKLSTYLSCGIIPIYSSVLIEFSRLTKNCKYKIELNDKNDIDKIMEFMNEKTYAENIYSEYKELFEKYYNREMYIKEIALKIGEFNEG